MEQIETALAALGLRLVIEVARGLAGCHVATWR
jgi:hypothetical protein